MAKTTGRTFLVAGALVVLAGLIAATGTTTRLLAAAPPTPVPIWANGAPGALGQTDADVPALLPYLPAATKRTGAAIVIVPGARAGALNLDREGTEVATWLNEQGIAAFVLRYRVAPKYGAEASTADVNRAVQYVRAHAAEFKVSPSRIGTMGFGSGAATEADAIYNHALPGEAAAADQVARASSTPSFMALLYGSAPLAANAPAPPPTFMVASARTEDGQSAAVDLWARLRAVRTPVDAHFFAKADASLGLAKNDPSLSAWPSSFMAWVTFRGFLTDTPRVPLKGMAYLDGRPLPHGYVIFTPIDDVGAGPVVARVINSTAGVPIGEFMVPVAFGPTPGRYRVEMHQNANRWLSNSFSNDLIRDPAFGHARLLTPSIEDHKVYTKVRPTDRDDYTVTIGPAGADGMRIEVFTGQPPINRTVPPIAGMPDAASANPGVAAYLEQLKHTPDPVPGIPNPIYLWPNGAPEAKADASGVFTTEDKPALLPFPAAANINTGAALLVMPGGAFTNRCEDQEGVQIAKWLNRQGISAFVLRYRLRPNYTGQVPIMDAHRGMQWVRAHAKDYGISPDRIGTIGFSAGSELEGDAFFNNQNDGNPSAADPIDRLSAKSNFNVLIYGGRNVTAPASAPPTFMFVTIEDGSNHLAPEINVLNGLRGAGVPVEAHWYQDGPHGTSMSPGDPQLGQWPDLMARWLRAMKIVR